MGNTFPFLDETDYFRFPPVEQSTPEGIVGVGGNLSPGMLLSAYSQGIFPWYSGNEPILWWAPNPRFVLFPKELHVPRRLERILRQGRFTFSADRKFREVIAECSRVPRPGQDGTWITDEMLDAYSRLHELGYAHSVEVYESGTGELAGGLYGVSLGALFFGESMFSRVSNASKAGFVAFARRLFEASFALIDCQVYTEHLARFGARNIERSRFMELLSRGLSRPGWKRKWVGLFGDGLTTSAESCPP